MSYAQLEALGRKLEAVDHAIAILSADEATNMPVGGGEKRAEAVAHLAGLRHETFTAPEIADWLDAAKSEDLSAEQKLSLAEFERVYTNATCLPADFVREQTRTNMRSEQLWRDLRAKNDWAGFAPALESVVALAREEAAMRADKLGLAPYDAMMEQYDPGNRAAEIAPIFDQLKTFLVDFVPEALENQADLPLKPVTGPFAIEDQRALGLAMMAALGFDFTHGRLDVSHHPFCGGVPTDVRMTTRYRTDEFLTALMGILHETGHALYEQGLPRDLSHMPVGKARGMAIHESQSLFVEQQLARTEPFWHWALPHLQEHLGADALPGWMAQDVLARVNMVERGFIRVDADEVTYPLHIILRFEIEQDLISGALSVVDLPEVWDAKMEAYLGLKTIDNPADGPMQDVHWPAGAFGYFPSYTLGAMMAAQQWAAIEKAHPSLNDDIARGDFHAVNAWRSEHIWQQASRYSTPELLTRATGAPLDPQFFIAHLKKRYG
ncbi:carboxypeptidase M32 [Pelagibacterium lentulum]|uniref:Metal-dependent carboxypeptidase n=1 Tax=Pelagibacterium lentulum TaxID=2029865 RepID=A0A916RBD0_9HYPH|nr:carboxypeptidase M32 [Pelagibacterium lentulum]GGA47701.1 carboxypeptidase Taq [Pelagibacterium lentulum]